jgi:hypothetical protein
MEQNLNSKPPVPKINLKESLLEDPIFALKHILKDAENFRTFPKELRENPHFVIKALNSANGEQIKKILIGNITDAEDERNARGRIWVLLNNLKREDINPSTKGPDGRPLTYYKSNELVDFLKTIKVEEEVQERETVQ